MDTFNPTGTALVTTPAPQHATGTSATYASVDAFRSLAGRPVTEEVAVPPLDGARVIVKAPTALDVQAARTRSNTTKGGKTVTRVDRDFATVLVWLCTVNPDGSRYFPDDMLVVLNRDAPYGAIQPLANAILRLGGFTDEVEDDDSPNS